MIDWLTKIRSKPTRMAIGLMSGTSADEVDACLCEISGFGQETSARVVHLASLDYPSHVRHLLTHKIGNLNVEEVARLNFLVARVFAQSVLKCIEEADCDASDIDFIASHGQTLAHYPDTGHEHLPVRATLQVGDISVIAQLTQIVTIGDFRPADMARGGQGAPLVPYADLVLFGDPSLGRVVQNIGGIANLTYLPPGCIPETVVAFDTGPGNMVIDAIVDTLTQGKQTMDTDGKLAFSGTVNQEFLNYLMSHEYFAKIPPKSTGREAFGVQYTAKILDEYKRFVGAPAERWALRSYLADIVATVSELTVQTMVAAYRWWILPRGPIDEVILGGGGARNAYFVTRLREELLQINPCIKVLTHQDFGISDKAKEALAFAILGNQFVGGLSNNIPAATGASGPVVMGKLALPW
jgi:anhydro-N-acetylmuramic acid kinase